MQRPEIDNIRRYVAHYRAKGVIDPAENTAVEGIEACLRWIDYLEGVLINRAIDEYMEEHGLKLKPAPDRAVTREEG